MDSLSLDLDVEAQAAANGATETQPAIVPDPLLPPPTNTENPQLPTTAEPPQATNANEDYNGNAPGQKTADNSQVQRDENYGDSSDGLWSMYLTEAEKQDGEVTESWKGDTDGILVFTGLFSATVASFIIESYQNLSPDSSDTTNALLTQISQQLVNISSGTPLTSVSVQSGQPFKPTASAVRVNVLWFLSLILSLTCALSATLMQQWARRYRELAQRRGAFHRRGRMRAYIFEGVDRFEMTRAVATMPTLLHISVFLFFAGLVDFLFPIYATVAYVTLGSIGVFALAYSILTFLPTIYLNCPYGTPLSGFAWRISQFSAFAFLWTILKVEGIFRKPLLKLWSLANRHVAEPPRLETWRETIEEQVKIHRDWFSQSLRKRVRLSAYEAKSTAVTSALEWTLTALDEDKEIEDFAARVPGFFDSRAVPDATSAVLSLMSHQPNTDPIFGSRLNDLLKTCTPETSVLDETMRKHRLRVCLNCLWYFGRAYNQPGGSQPLPSYFLNTLIPEISRRVQTEEDSALRMLGRCAVAVIINKLVTDLESRTIPIDGEERACLSGILGTESHDVELLLSQPGAVALANTISFTFDNIGGLVTDTVTSGVLDVVQQTLEILSRAFLSEQNPEVQLDQPVAIFNGSDGNFERVLVSRLLDLLNACTQVTSPLTYEVCRSCELVCLKGLWYFGRAFNQLGNSMPLPSNICIAVTNLEISRLVSVNHVIAYCVVALVVNKLVSDLKSRIVSVTDRELACLSAFLGTKRDDVMLLLSHPGAVEFTNMVFIVLDNSYFYGRASSHMRDMVQQTFGILSHWQALPPDLGSKMRLNQTGTLMNLNVSDGTSFRAADPYMSNLHARMKNLWDFIREYNEPGNVMSLPSYVWIAFTNPEMTRRIHQHDDCVRRAIGCCMEALVVNKLAADINLRNVPVSDDELACLSAILGTKSDDVMLLLSHPGAVEFTNMVFLALDALYIHTPGFGSVPSYVLDVVEQTFTTLSRSLPPEWNAEMQPNQTDTAVNVSDEISPLTDLSCEIYGNVLRVWMKNLWNFARKCNEDRNVVSLSSYIWIPFTNPEMTRRIHQDNDLVTRTIGCCIKVLVVNKLAADIRSRNVPVSDDELACLSTILGTKSDDVMLLLNHPGAVEFTNMVFLALDALYIYTPGSVPSYVLDVVEQTFTTLSRSLPPELKAEMQLNQTDAAVKIFDEISPLTDLTAEIYGNVLRVWMKNLWNFARKCNEARNVVSLPSCVWIPFANPEMTRLMTRHIQQDNDLVTCTIGCCIKAFVVNKLAADIRSRNVPVSADELACLSTILGTKSDNVMLLLGHPGAVEFTNMVFLALDVLYFDFCEKLPSYVFDVVQQTSSTLSLSLPPELNAQVRLNPTDAPMNVSDETSSHMAEMCRGVLHAWMKNLWHFVREYNEPGGLVSLPSYLLIAFANPEMTRRIHESPWRDLATYAIGRSVEALVVNNLAADINSRSVPIGEAELACLSAILGTASYDVGLCLSLPGTIQLVNLASLTLSDYHSLQIDQLPLDTSHVLHETLAILSRALPAQGNADLPLDQTISLVNVSDHEPTIPSRLHGLLEMCILGASSLMEDARISCLRMCLRTLWHWVRAYYLPIFDPLPSYFPLVLARPEIIHHLQNEQDPVTRITGCCFSALIVCKLVGALDSPIFLGGRVHNPSLACISAILGTGHREVLLSPHQLHVLNFRNVVSLMSREFDTLMTAAGMPADVLKIAKDTLYILANDDLGYGRGLPEDQRLLLPEIRSDIVKALRSDQFENETVETLVRFRQILEKLLPEVE